MAKPSTRSTTRDIPEDKWNAYLSEFTRENRGAHARLDVIKVDEIGYGVPTENRPFDGVSADTKAGEREVWIMFAATGDRDHLTHGVPSVTAIRELPPETERGAVLEVESKDGTRTLLTLTPPEEFMLPPSEQQERRS